MKLPLHQNSKVSSALYKVNVNVWNEDGFSLEFGVLRPGLAWPVLAGSWKDKFCRGWGLCEVLRKSGLALSDKEDWAHLNLNTRPNTLPALFVFILTL